MTEDTPTPILRGATSSSNAIDLRRIGAHPDYWYPLAWSHELPPGKALGRRFAGEPIVLYTAAHRVACLRSRTAALTARYRCTSAW